VNRQHCEAASTPCVACGKLCEGRAGLTVDVPFWMRRPGGRREDSGTGLLMMALLGHSHITLTLGSYSHLVPERAGVAADRMGTAL